MKTKDEDKKSRSREVEKSSGAKLDPTPRLSTLDSQLDLSPGQITVLESLLEAGFRFVTFERYARYLAVEREGFVALLEISEGKVRLFGQVGYHVGEGIAMLVERAGGKAFTWKSESVPATPEMLAAYERFRQELNRLLKGSEGEPQLGGTDRNERSI